MRKKLLLNSLLLLLVIKSIAAAQPDSAAVISAKKKLSVTPFPALFYSPETGFGYGVIAVPVYNFGHDTLTRNSTGQVLVYYTTEKQASAQLSYTIYTNQERYAILGETNYYDAPIYYYGTGNFNTEADKSLISYKLLYTQNRILKQLKKNIFLGGQFQVIRVGQAEYEPELSLLERRPETELNGYTAVGLGPSFLLDSRDNSINASAGAYVEIGSFFNGKSMGSEFNFTRHTLDLRKYKTLSKRQVIAGQLKSIFETGNVPFRELACFGGHRTMRGFYEGRFRDKQMLMAQAEYRLQVLKRSGLVAFSSAGQVAEKPGNFNLGRTKVAGGLGYRFMLNTKEKINIRIDYAWGTGGTSGLYFAIGEAF